MTDESISLTDLPRRLREITGPSYRQLYAKVLDSNVPAQRHNGRWGVSETVARDLAKKLIGGRP